MGFYLLMVKGGVCGINLEHILIMSMENVPLSQNGKLCERKSCLRVQVNYFFPKVMDCSKSG